MKLKHYASTYSTWSAWQYSLKIKFADIVMRSETIRIQTKKVGNGSFDLDQIDQKHQDECIAETWHNKIVGGNE